MILAFLNLRYFIKNSWSMKNNLMTGLPFPSYCKTSLSDVSFADQFIVVISNDDFRFYSICSNKGLHIFQTGTILFCTYMTVELDFGLHFLLRKVDLCSIIFCLQVVQIHTKENC